LSFNVSFIVISKSYMISNCLSGVILTTFGAVQTMTDINDIDTIIELIEKPGAVIICVDNFFLNRFKSQLKSLPDSKLIIPVCDSSFIKNSNLPFVIDISSDKRQIIDLLNKAANHLTEISNKTNTTKELTRREVTILRLVAKGLTTKNIAEKLNISDQTVSSHRKNICSKLEIKTVSGLTAYAIINGLIELDESDFS
jgi:DNA-binding CsgD family transcriptional regulator